MKQHPLNSASAHPRNGGTAAMTEVWLRASLTHDIIDQAQYSYLIAAVIGSAVVPTLVANAFFVPRYLLPKTEAPSLAGPVPHAMAVGEREG